MILADKNPLGQRTIDSPQLSFTLSISKRRTRQRTKKIPTEVKKKKFPKKGQKERRRRRSRSDSIRNPPDRGTRNKERNETKSNQEKKLGILKSEGKNLTGRTHPLPFNI